jgi:DNA-directed RNA polymerase I subunit RPA43
MVKVESPFTASTIILKVALRPMHCQRPIEAVKGQLNDLLLKYSEDIQGVPLSYSGLELPRGLENGRILAEQPFVHVDLRATVTMFRPVRGLRIRGRINKVSDSHISLLVYGMFNASLSAGELVSNSYEYNYETIAWESAEWGDLIEGESMEVEIASFQHANGVLNLGCVFARE